jgi:urease alpha subunit
MGHREADVNKRAHLRHRQGWQSLMDGVSPALVIGQGQNSRGRGQILTAGGIDTYSLYLSAANYRGVGLWRDDMIGGGLGPATGTNATTLLVVEPRTHVGSCRNIPAQFRVSW